MKHRCVITVEDQPLTALLHSGGTVANDRPSVPLILSLPYLAQRRQWVDGRDERGHDGRRETGKAFA